MSKIDTSYEDISRKQFVVAIEGLDGSGKSSLVKAIVEAFKGVSIESYVGDWFRDSEIQKLAMTFNRLEQMTPEVLAALHAATTIYQIRDARNSNCQVVIWDRYIYSSYASCAIRGANKSLMKSIVESIPEPDLCLLLIEEPYICYQRVVERKGVRFFESNVDRIYRNRISKGLDAFERREISESLLKEVFIHAGQEWYLEVKEALAGKRVELVKSIDINNAHHIVELVVESALNVLAVREM